MEKEKGDKLDKGRKVCELLLDRPGMRKICFPGHMVYLKKIENDSYVFG
ncbi:hypothetical protein [Methanosarcina lacustris]|nr:hypothetical protein [Methanosarcina lacustris]